MYPTSPIFREHSPHFRKQPFKLKGWTDTVLGYLYEADKLSRCILRNREYMGCDYTLEASINIHAELPPHLIKQTWDKAKGRMKEHGVTALWIREPSLSNHCNYHLLVKSNHSEEEFKQIIEASMPPRSPRSNVPFHKHVSPIDSQYHYSRYITKAKTAGVVNGKEIKDKYRNKRLMFAPRLGLKKYGTIGPFWEKPKKVLWDEIIEIERRVAEGKEKPGVKEKARQMYELLGGCVPLDQIERNYGYYAEDLYLGNEAE